MLCVPIGVWARALGRLAGVHVPLVAMHHAYVVTERIEGIQVGPALLFYVCPGDGWKQNHPSWPHMTFRTPSCSASTPQLLLQLPALLEPYLVFNDVTT